MWVRNTRRPRTKWPKGISRRWPRGSRRNYQITARSMYPTRPRTTFGVTRPRSIQECSSSCVERWAPITTNLTRAARRVMGMANSVESGLMPPPARGAHHRLGQRHCQPARHPRRRTAPRPSPSAGITAHGSTPRSPSSYTSRRGAHYGRVRRNSNSIASTPTSALTCASGFATRAAKSRSSVVRANTLGPCPRPSQGRIRHPWPQRGGASVDVHIPPCHRPQPN